MQLLDAGDFELSLNFDIPNGAQIIVSLLGVISKITGGKTATKMSAVLWKLLTRRPVVKMYTVTERAV